MKLIIELIFFCATIGQILCALTVDEALLAESLNFVANQFLYQNNSLPSYDPAPGTPIEKDVTFYCYDRTKGKIFIMDPNNHTLPASGQIHFMFHGWTQGFNASWVQGMFDGYRNYVGFAYFCFVDWSRLAYFEYQLAVNNTYKVGGYVGQKIVDWGVPADKFHLVGHSLGAQVAGETGRVVIALSGQLISRIFGLDAAGPLYCQPRVVPKSRRLGPEDAKYVQGIHTSDTPINGCMIRYGTQDFYPNGGAPPQPGCTSLVLGFNNTAICSHFKVIEYYRRTLDRNVIAEGCNELAWWLNNCKRFSEVRFGLYNQVRKDGKYYFDIK